MYGYLPTARHDDDCKYIARSLDDVAGVNMVAILGRLPVLHDDAFHLQYPYVPELLADLCGDGGCYIGRIEPYAPVAGEEWRILHEFAETDCLRQRDSHGIVGKPHLMTGGDFGLMV